MVTIANWIDMPPSKKELKEFEDKLSEAQANIDSIQKKIDEAAPVVITSIIERLELIEEKLGVRFDALYGVCIKRTWETPEDFLIEVNFDVIGTVATLKRSFKPTLSAYNSAGQLLNTESSFIHNVNFLGIESMKIQLLCREIPVRVRLYPANPM